MPPTNLTVGLKQYAKNSTMYTKIQNHNYAGVKKDAMPRSPAFSETLFKWTVEGMSSYVTCLYRVK